MSYVGAEFGSLKVISLLGSVKEGVAGSRRLWKVVCLECNSVQEASTRMLKRRSRATKGCKLCGGSNAKGFVYARDEHGFINKSKKIYY